MIEVISKRYLYLLIFLIFTALLISSSTSTTAIPTPPKTDCKCLGYSLITLQVPLNLDLPNGSDFDLDIFAYNGEQQVSSRLIDMEWFISHPEFLPLSNIDDMHAFPDNLIVDSIERDKIIFTLKNLNQQTLPRFVTFKVAANQIFHGDKKPIENIYATFRLDCNPELQIGYSFKKFTIVNLIKVENTSDVCKGEFCGNNRIEQNEQCEYPNTFDNPYCPNPDEITCQGNKTSLQINLAGNCNSQCQCEFDEPYFACAKNSCGASCSEGETQTESCGVTDVGECKLGTKTRICDDNSCSFGNFVECTGNIDPVTEICNDNKDNDCDGQIDENCVPLPNCGDGIKNINEQCELPNTNNNQYCSQSTTSCLINKTGSRDSYGICGAACSCVSDGFSYSCKKGSCGAACSTGETRTEQCGVSNIGVCKLGTRTDTCDSNSYSCQFNIGQCVGAVFPGNETCNQLDDDCDGQVDEGNVCGTIPICGNNILEQGEECDPPGQVQAQSCGTTDTGECQLGTQTRTCNYQCKFTDYGQCTGNIEPTPEICDQKDNNCNGQTDENNVCQPQQFCGDGTVNGNEQCELPSTNNNQFCSQSGNICAGNKTGSRDSYGYCSSQCSCVNDQFSYSCVKGSCGATCNSGEIKNETCGFNNVGICRLGTRTASCYEVNCQFDSFTQCQGAILPGTETCNQLDDDCDGLVDEGNICGTIPICGNNILEQGEECDPPGQVQAQSCGTTDVGECQLGTQTRTCNYQCKFTDYGQCTGNIEPTPEICDEKDNNCNGQTDENNVCVPQNFCGDGNVTGNEQCELPSTNNNQFCSQSATQCFGKKTGTRDIYGYCSSQCSCVNDQFAKSCVKNSCGASCSEGETQTESCGVTDVGECRLGTKTRICDDNSCSFGNFGQCTGNIDPVQEVCNDNKDNDCDGLTDNNDDDCEGEQPICGNGVREGNEQCDDGNLISGDGCSSTCKIEEEDECPPISITDISGKLTKVTTSTIGIGTTPIVSSEFPILVFLDPNSRILVDDCNSPGRVSGCGQKLVERINNYAFEGEQIKWDVFVYDKSGIEFVKDVFVSLGPSPGPGNDIEANCKINDRTDDPICVFIDEKVEIKFNPQTSRWYTCTLAVETPESMYGEYFVTVEAEDLEGNQASMDEQEYWFFNPIIGLNINGEIDFGNIRPGTIGYSRTLSVENAADQGSGVLLDMFISGTDFYDQSSSGALCPDSNVLRLTNFRYYAVNGAYSTKGNPNADTEGYRPIPYERSGTGGLPNNGRQEIIQNGLLPGGYSLGNVLSPGAEQSLTFKLNMPEPCNGDFNSGQIFFWGEAI